MVYGWTELDNFSVHVVASKLLGKGGGNSSLAARVMCVELWYFFNIDLQPLPSLSDVG